MIAPLSDDQLQELCTIDTATVSNIIEFFDVRPQNEGFMWPAIQCQTPEVGIVAGYACPATLRGMCRGSGDALAGAVRFFEWSQQIPKPRFSVIQDIDDPPFNSFLGEVCANLHLACGFVASASSSYYRDVDQVAETGIAVFSRGVGVSHGYGHLVEIGEPVHVAGLTVRAGDLLHGDRHGIIKIPHEIAGEIAGRLKDLLDKEGPIIALCKSGDFSLKKLKELLKL